jgi:beta-lactam-binding protein with PASTA domain
LELGTRNIAPVTRNLIIYIFAKKKQYLKSLAVYFDKGLTHIQSGQPFFMNFIQFITTKQFLKQLAYSILLFIAIAWITLMILKFYTRHNEVAVTPNYVGLSMEQVNSLESSRDFELVIVDSIYDYTRKPGTVISQDPIPETKVKPGRSIYLSLVSFKPEQVSMPELIDLSLRRAKALLQTYGLKLGSIRIVPDMAENAVLKCSVRGKYVKPGTLILKGSVVDLVIGSGSGYGLPTVPFLIGKTREAARLELSRLGFFVGNETYSGDCDSTNAQIFEQDPLYIYGKRIESGSSFSLTYKSGTDFDFDEYINNLVIDTIPPETPLP